MNKKTGLLLEAGFSSKLNADTDYQAMVMNT